MPSTRDQLIALLDPADDSRHPGTAWEGHSLNLRQATAIADAILAVFTLAPVEDEEKTVKLDPTDKPTKRHLLTEPHDGHGEDETCPGCPRLSSYKPEEGKN